MRDGYRRDINYLRISVTDLCNLRCTYCMPEDGVQKFDHDKILTVDEIEGFVKQAVKLGVNKVRLTGGEPLLRPGIIEICHRISAIEGIKELCITTNGLLLKKYAKDLKLAGVSRLNISLDTLDNEKYKKVTRCTFLDNPVDLIFEGIEKAKTVGFSNFKINTVLMGGVNDDEISDFIELTKDHDISVRFIELMPIGEAMHWDKSSFISNDEILKREPDLQYVEDGLVSRIYRKPGYKGTVGLISTRTNHFCSNCNRIRLTADGKLKACLHSDAETVVKGLSEREIYEAIKNEIAKKPENFDLRVENPSHSHSNMNQIGG